MSPEEAITAFQNDVADLKEAASELYTLLADVGFTDQYPVQLAAFREAFGIEEKKEPLGPLEPGRRIAMPNDDALYPIVRSYHLTGAEIREREALRKKLKSMIVGPMGEAAELAFYDGSSAVRRQITRPAYTVKEVTYEELRVNWKGAV